MIDHPLDVMIFSKDRPLQLDGLLRSMSINMPGTNTCVLYHYLDDYANAIVELKESHPGVAFIEQTDFLEQVKGFVKRSAEYCMFLVDDIVFKEAVDMSLVRNAMDNNPRVMTFSLRLGLNLNRCYPLEADQPVPQGNVYTPGVFVWDWKNSEMDWNYPLSVDGHIFRSNQFSTWLTHLQFDKPNSYEATLQTIRQRYPLPPLSMCYVRSKVVNLPINRVQQEFENKCGDIDPASLLELWHAGKRMDIAKYQGILNNGAHEELELYIEEV